MLLGPILLALAQTPKSPPASPTPREVVEREDEEAFTKFRRLSSGERKDFADYFRLECSRLGTFQVSLVRFVLEEQEREPSTWPEDGPAPHYASSEHTPENDIPRRVLAEDAPEVARQKAVMLARRPKAEFESGWRYDYGSRELRRAKSWKDPERIFANGLKGLSPDHDLARALVELALDDGSQRKSLGAFDHAYTDREGNVYPGITLHDAWASGREIEMPDVDALGIVHDVLGDWTTWKAPVPAAQHDALYERVGELYAPAHVHRTIRHALAACYLEGSPADCEGYETYLDNLHTLWEDCRSTPEVLAQRLPSPEERAEFFELWTRTCFEKGELFQAGLARRKTLKSDSQAVRTLLLRLLEEFVESSDDSK